MIRPSTRFWQAAGLAAIVAALVWTSTITPRAQSGAAPYAPELFKALEWRSIGPARGGRSIAGAGVVGRPYEYYFGAVGGGLWKTADGGATWSPVTDGQIRSSSVGAVAVSESSPDVVYIGMGEACIRGNIMQGDGVYKSTDAGRTWTHMGLAETHVISEIVIHPKNADVVYAAAFGHPPAPNEERGVYRSKDGGKTWQRVLFRDNKTAAIDLVMDRNNPNVLYAALWEAYRVSYQMSSGGAGSGLFKTTDGGDTWTELTRKPGMPAGIIGRIGVAVSGADSNRVYALVENENGGVFRSDDGGETWTKTNDDRRLRQRAFYYTHIYADPKDKDTVYGLNTGFYKSIDGGKTFPITIRVPHGDNHNLWIDPTNPMRMINGNDGGGTVSVNGGQTWTDEDYPTAQFYHVATTKDVPYQVCGAQQDNSTACVPSDGGRNRAINNLYAAGGGESGYIAPHPANPDLFYAGSQGALITKYNRATGYTRDIQPYPWFFSGEPSSALKERWQWTFPIVFSPQDPNVLYITSQHLWKTTNDGQSWQKISPDLTKADTKTLGHSGGPITGDMNGPEIFATIFALAPSKHDANTIWTGSDDGALFITRDGGKNWTNITPPDLPELARVSIVDASAHDPATAYFAAKRYLLDDRKPYVYRTHDYGKTWTKIVSGIRADDYAHVVREDPKRKGLLYAGTEHGVYVSFDDGDRWQSLSLNLPDTQVSDMVVEEKDLVIATHGRSFYILDDISPLRQMAPGAATADVTLFQPADAIRSTGPATIYYALGKASDKVTIEIVDPKGAAIDTFTRTAEEERQGPSTGAGQGGGGGGGFGFGAQSRPSTKAGLNKFTWNMRYPGHTTFPGMILWSAGSQGPAAVPGTYQVRVTANGRTETRPLTIRMHPLYKDVTQADLEEQFRLAIQVRDKTSEANNAVIRIRAIRAQVDDRLGKTKNAKVASSGDGLKKKLSAVEEELYQVRNQSGQDPLNFPIKLNNRLASLRRSVETGDGKPTEGSYTVFKELSAATDEQLKRLEEMLQTELAAFNDLLKRQKLEPISGR